MWSARMCTCSVVIEWAWAHSLFSVLFLLSTTTHTHFNLFSDSIFVIQCVMAHLLKYLLVSLLLTGKCNCVPSLICCDNYFILCLSLAWGCSAQLTSSRGNFTSSWKMTCQQLLISNRSANFISWNTGLWGLRGSYYICLKVLAPYLPSTSNWSRLKM